MKFTPSRKKSLVTVGGLAALIASGALFGWIVLAITVFLLIPWDVGIPPSGTFAEAVNNFFESGNALIPSLIVILCELVALAQRLLNRQHPIYALLWRFTFLNVAVALISTAVTLAGMFAARLLFPNHDPWEGDQSYGVALVYWGLIVTSALIAYFARLVWVAPHGLKLQQTQPAQ